MKLSSGYNKNNYSNFPNLQNANKIHNCVLLPVIPTNKNARIIKNIEHTINNLKSFDDQNYKINKNCNFNHNSNFDNNFKNNKKDDEEYNITDHNIFIKQRRSISKSFNKAENIKMQSYIHTTKHIKNFDNTFNSKIIFSPVSISPNRSFYCAQKGLLTPLKRSSEKIIKKLNIYHTNFEIKSGFSESKYSKTIKYTSTFSIHENNISLSINHYVFNIESSSIITNKNFSILEKQCDENLTKIFKTKLDETYEEILQKTQKLKDIDLFSAISFSSLFDIPNCILDLIFLKHRTFELVGDLAEMCKIKCRSYDPMLFVINDVINKLLKCENDYVNSIKPMILKIINNNKVYVEPLIAIEKKTNNLLKTKFQTPIQSPKQTIKKSLTVCKRSKNISSTTNKSVVFLESKQDKTANKTIDFIKTPQKIETNQTFSNSTKLVLQEKEIHEIENNKSYYEEHVSNSSINFSQRNTNSNKNNFFIARQSEIDCKTLEISPSTSNNIRLVEHTSLINVNNIKNTDITTNRILKNSSSKKKIVKKNTLNPKLINNTKSKNPISKIQLKTNHHPDKQIPKKTVNEIKNIRSIKKPGTVKLSNFEIKDFSKLKNSGENHINKKNLNIVKNKTDLKVKKDNEFVEDKNIGYSNKSEVETSVNDKLDVKYAKNNIVKNDIFFGKNSKKSNNFDYILETESQISSSSKRSIKNKIQNNNKSKSSIDKLSIDDTISYIKNLKLKNSLESMTDRDKGNIINISTLSKRNNSFSRNDSVANNEIFTNKVIQTHLKSDSFTKADQINNNYSLSFKNKEINLKNSSPDLTKEIVHSKEIIKNEISLNLGSKYYHSNDLSFHDKFANIIIK